MRQTQQRRRSRTCPPSADGGTRLLLGRPLTSWPGCNQRFSGCSTPAAVREFDFLSSYMRGTCLAVALLSLGAFGAEDGGAEEEKRAPTVQDLLPGWQPAVFPPEGMTKGHFRANYGRAWDSVSRALGGRVRASERLRKQQELMDTVNAQHRKLGLEGASVDSLVNGPSADHVTQEGGRQMWTLEDAYKAMHNAPYLLNEAGHAGQVAGCTHDPRARRAPKHALPVSDSCAPNLARSRCTRWRVTRATALTRSPTATRSSTSRCCAGRRARRRSSSSEWRRARLRSTRCRQTHSGHLLLRGSGRHYSARAAGWYQLSGWLVPLLLL